jgi:hypothetical protein
MVSPTAYLVVDTESVPDGKLLSQVKYPGDNLAPDQAIERAQAEARARSSSGSDFLPVTFQIPVAVCVVEVGLDFAIVDLVCHDAPLFRPAEIVRQFWQRVEEAREAKLVTFNGLHFDLPLLELAAFRHGSPAPRHFLRSRERNEGNHLDLLDWLTNHGAFRLNGGLNLCAKILGKPGKMEVTGGQVYGLHRAGEMQKISDYSMYDALDTYFVFLRTRVLAGELTPNGEGELIQRARGWIESRLGRFPALRHYLDHWETLR